MKAAAAGGLFVAGLIVASAEPVWGLTQMPEEAFEYGRAFDVRSPRAQTMERVLCFGRNRAAACSDGPARYFGARFECDWPKAYADRMVPDNLPDKGRYFLPSAWLPVGDFARGQTCYFRALISIPPFLLQTDDRRDLMGYVEWEFEKEMLPGLVGKKEGDRRILLPFFPVDRSDGGSHVKNPWDGDLQISVGGRTRRKDSAEMYMLPSRVGAKAQKSWMTIIVNGQVLDRVEVEFRAEPLKWIEYDWRRKNGQVFQVTPGM